MANIYERAKIKSGDPLGSVSESAREASTLLEQFRHKKDIIDEINKAIADAKKKSKKDRGLFSGAGSLLGGLLSAAIPGGPLVSALLSGAGAGIGEKFRQDKYDPTKELRKVKSKLKGRKQYKDVAGTTELFEEGLKGGLTSDIMMSAILGGLMPMEFTKGVGASSVPMNLSGGASAIPIDPIKGGLKFGGANEALAALLPEKLAHLVGDEELPQWLLGLLRSAGPSFASQNLSPRPYAAPYAQPQFRNPFGSTGGY